MVATAWSDQLKEGYRKRPIEDHGKLRCQTFHYKNETGGTLPDGTEIDLCKLPPGAKRIIPSLSRVKTVTAGGASRVLDIGHRAYRSKYNPNPQNPEAENDEAFMSNKDISSAIGATVLDASNDLFYDIYSMEEVVVFATIDGGTIPANLEIEGMITYLYE